MKKLPHSSILLNVAKKRSKKATSEAILAERERCAKIAEHLHKEYERALESNPVRKAAWYDGASQASLEIARKIREGYDMSTLMKLADAQRR